MSRRISATSAESSAVLDGASPPKWDTRRRAVGILDSDPAHFDAFDLVAEQDDIASEAFHGKILVHGTHHRPFGLGHDRVVGRVRDSPPEVIALIALHGGLSRHD